MSDLDLMVEQACKLGREEREILADKILESLDAEGLNEIDEAWLEESERRYERYKRGETKGIPLEEVLTKIRNQREENADHSNAGG